MFIAGVKTLTVTTYIKSVFRVMGCTTYWEPETTYADFAALQADANDWQDQMTAVFKPLMPDQVELPVTHVVYSDGSSVQFDAYSALGNATTGNAATIVLEDAGSTVLPDIDALIIQRKTGVRGRQHAGRIFIPGIWEGFNNDGQLNAAGMAKAEDVAVFLGADYNNGTRLFHARHWNRKDDLFEVVVDCRVRRDLARRGDRAIQEIALAY